VRLVFLQTAGVGLLTKTRTLTMVGVMMHQISQTARQRASTTISVLDSTGILPLERVNAAGCMDLGLVHGTTALLQESRTTS